MYFAEQEYVSGFSAFIVGIIALIGFIFIGKTGFIIKGLRRLRCRTVSEFFGMRFNVTTQVLAGIITFVSGLMNMGMFLIIAAKFILHMVVFCGLFVLLWGYLYKPPETVFRFLAITGTMYFASVLLIIAMGLYWRRANAYGASVSIIMGGVLPLTAIFIKDASFCLKNFNG